MKGAIQMAIQSTNVTVEEIQRKKTLGSAIELCAELGGFALDKQLSTTLGVDKAQFSRWTNGTEGILWPKFTALMDACGNDVPLLWMAHARGYDIASIHKRETELERENRLLREELDKERLKARVLADAINGRSAS